MRNMLIALLTLAAFSACKHKSEEPTGQVEYLIVGQSSCFCVDCCKTGYKIEGAELYQGERDNQGVYVFENAPLPAAKYEIAKVLVDELPDQLLNENGKTYGCPGCADEPVYYVELKKDGVVYTWHIDSITDGFPDYVQDYSAKLGQVINTLNQ